MEQVIQEFAGGADERFAKPVFMKARCFTHEHDRGVRVARTEDDLGSTETGKLAALAVVKRSGEFLEAHQQAFEFNGIPNPTVVRSLKTSLGNATLEGNSVHLRMAMEANEAQQKFAQIISGQVGQQLGALIEAARYLPARENVAPKQTKPVIYGLDDGPRVVNQD